MDTRIHIKSAFTLVLMICFSGMTVAREINTGASGNVAILGYDPVAYFTEQRAVKGSEKIAYNWLGAEWNFSSEKHKNMFSTNPVKYAPQYGGHCADGVAYGVTVKYIDPTAWRIIEGKLYLHYDEESAIHLEETEGELEKSIANWPALRAELLNESD
jgi:YHS domain-containing protein